jgi:hypothetical protein
MMRRLVRAAMWGGAIAYFVHLIRKVTARLWPLAWKIEAVAELAVLAVLAFGVLLFAFRVAFPGPAQRAAQRARHERAERAVRGSSAAPPPPPAPVSDVTVILDQP